MIHVLQKENVKNTPLKLLCFRMLLHPWLMPRLGAMLTMWVSFFLHCRLVYTEGDTTVLLHTKWQKPLKKKNKKTFQCGEKGSFPRPGYCNTCIILASKEKKIKLKRGKKITFFILYLRYFVLCILILWVFHFWRFCSLVAGCRQFFFVVDLERC